MTEEDVDGGHVGQRGLEIVLVAVVQTVTVQTAGLEGEAVGVDGAADDAPLRVPLGNEVVVALGREDAQTGLLQFQHRRPELINRHRWGIRRVEDVAGDDQIGLLGEAVSDDTVQRNEGVVTERGTVDPGAGNEVGVTVMDQGSCHGCLG